MGLKSALSKSSIIKNSYEYSRGRLSEYYRLYNRGSGHTDEYEILTDETAEEPEDDDTGLAGEGFRPKPHPKVSNPVLTRKDVDDCLAHFVADPFVVYERGVYNMFFEIMSVGRRVFIGHAFSEDGLNYRYNRIVIDPETAEHSYPHVFKKDGEWIMVPSPGANVNGEFRVYKATSFPTEWELVEVPIREGVRLDPTPILHDGVWYLIYQNTEFDVVLMYSDSLVGGGWNEHPDSPLFRNDTKRIRECSIGGAEMVPSGRPIYTDDGVELFYRSHINREVYHYRVTELTKESFSQRRISEDPLFSGTEREDWNRRFMHTVNPVYPWGGTEDVVAIDGLESDRYRWSIGIYTP